MKPTNLNKETCNPISSNCVIWQGPDIPCIQICKGDAVSDVVAKLATELCAILDILDVQNYDLTCFNITACGPQDFQQLIQFLIDQICALQNVTPTDVKSAGCPDCLVTVNQDCFSELGEVAQLVDYVTAIATKICGLVLQISAIQSAIVDLDDRVTVLESYFPLPAPTEVNITPDCVLPSVPTPVSKVLTALELQFCQLIGATGSATDIINASLAQCVANNDPRLDGGGDMDTIPGWFPVVTSIAESITNLWLTVCDIRNGLSTVSITPVDTQTVNLTVTGGPAFTLQADVVDTGWVNLNGFDYYTGSMANAKPQCRRIGSVIHFRGTIFVPLSSDGGPTIIPLSTTSTYNTQWFKDPWTGAADPTYGNGVILSGGGTMAFNYNGVTATNVIPTSVWNPAPGDPIFDGTYSTGTIIATRQIRTDLLANGTALSAVVGLFISDQGILTLQTLKDFEQVSGLITYQAASPLRYITSVITAGEHIPDHTAATSTIHSSPNSGTTTTTALPAPLGPDTQYINNLTLDYDTTPTWPFSCDAGLETDIGGFGFRIDGLMAYIAP